MIDERQETIDDIVKEIRGNSEHNHALVEVSKYLTEIADRIEAAAKRERESTCEKSSAVGNAAAMRDALNEIRSRLFYLYVLTDGTFNPPALKEVYEISDTALSDPPRNCDRFDSIEEAKTRYCAEVDHVFIWDGFQSQRLIKWLFAKKKEEQK